MKDSTRKMAEQLREKDETIKYLCDYLFFLITGYDEPSEYKLDQILEERGYDMSALEPGEEEPIDFGTEKLF